MKLEEVRRFLLHYGPACARYTAASPLSNDCCAVACSVGSNRNNSVCGIVRVRLTQHDKSAREEALPGSRRLTHLH